MRTIILLIFYSFVNSLFAQSPRDIIAKADSLTSLGQYEIAISLLESNKSTLLVADSTELKMLYNLYAGNAYLQTKEFDKAERNLRSYLALTEGGGGKYSEEYCIFFPLLIQVYNESYNYDKLLDSYLTYLDIIEKVYGKGISEYVNSLHALGTLYIQLSEYDLAEKYLLETLNIVREIHGEKHSSYAISLSNLAILHYEKDDYQQAGQYWKQSLAIGKETLGEQHPNYVRSLNNLGILYDEMGEYQQAELYYLQSLVIVKETLGEQHPDYAKWLTNLGTLYHKMGEYQQALKYYQQSLAITKEILGEQHPDYDRLLDGLGQLYYEMGEYQQAELYYQQSLAIVKKTLGEQHPDYFKLLNNLGALYDEMGDYQQAERYYQQSLDIVKETLGDQHPDYIKLLNNLGILHYEMGEYQQAELCYQQSLDIVKENLEEKHPAYANLLGNLGTLHDEMGDYQQAERYYQQSLAVVKETLGEQHPDYARLLSNLGALYRKKSDYQQAERHFQQSLAIRKEILGENHPDYARLLNRFGSLHFAMGDYQQAERYYQQSLAIVKETLGEQHSDYAKLLSNLGLLYYGKEEFQPAEQYLLTALNIQKESLGEQHPDYATISKSLATLYTIAGEYEKAEPFFLKSSALIRKDILRNFDFLSEKQREHYWKKNQGLFEFYPSFIYAYYPKKKSISAFAYDNELFRKGLLLNTSAEINNSILHSNDDDLQRDWNDLRLLRTQINSMQHLPLSEQSGLDSLEIRAEYLDKEIIKRSVSYRENRESLQIKWQEVQKNLEKGEVAIEFVAFDCYHKEYTDSLLYYALVLRKESDYPVLIPLFEESQLSALLKDNNPELSRRIQKLYNGSNPRFYNGQKLYDLVWKPLEQHLQDIKTVYYSPSGLLHRIAFSAIPVDTMWLNEKYNLHLLSSTREIVRLKKQEDSFLPIKQATSYGGILYDIEDAEKLIQSAQQYKTREPSYFASRSLPRDSTRSGWAYLQGTEKEVTEISDILKQSNISNSTITGIVANEESFKALSGNSPELLHIATHGFFLEDEKKIRESGFMNRLNHQNRPYVNPLLRSGLLFAGANRAWQNENIIPDIEDGILTAEEISHLDLSNTKLVVLSACETGLGEVQNSEGVFGLQRAFKLAGVETLVMSLWEVDDSTTSKFMVTFYQNLMAGKSKSDAFDIAQQTIRKEHSNPYYWAGFVMMD